MKGLLLKDFYMAMKYCRAYVVIAVVFSLFSIWGNTSFLIAYPILLASVIPVNLISYDEKASGAVTLVYFRIPGSSWYRSNI